MTAADFQALFDQPPARQGSDSLKWAKHAGHASRHGDPLLPMWVADMDFAAPPPVLAALRARLDHGIFGYGHATTRYRETLCAAMVRDYGWAVQPEWIVPLAGLVSGLNVAARAIGEAGDAIVTATPVYPPFMTAPRHMERGLVTVPLAEADNWSWNMDALRAAHTPRTRGLFLCHPHNPVGRVWTPAELDGLAAHAEAHDLVVVSDEIHCDLLLEPGLRHQPFAMRSAAMAARTITLMAPSKTYNIPGLGAAFALIPNANLRRRFERALAGICAHPNVLGQLACEVAYSDACLPWRAALLDYLRGNRDRLLALDGIGGLRITRPEATYLAWLDCRTLDCTDPARFFEDELGLGLSDGAEFGAPGFLRLNFGCPRATLDEAIRRLRRLG